MGRTVIEIPQEIQDQMCRDYRQGISVRNISRIYGIGRNKSYEIVHRGCCVKMGRPKVDNDIQCKNIAEDYINGLSIKKIAKKYGLSEWNVYRNLKKNDISVKDTTKQSDIINDLKCGELSQSDIAKKYGVSRQYVFQIKQKMGDNNDEDMGC